MDSQSGILTLTLPSHVSVGEREREALVTCASLPHTPRFPAYPFGQAMGSWRIPPLDHLQCGAQGWESTASGISSIWIPNAKHTSSLGFAPLLKWFWPWFVMHQGWLRLRFWSLHSPTLHPVTPGDLLLACGPFVCCTLSFLSH